MGQGQEAGADFMKEVFWAEADFASHCTEYHTLLLPPCLSLPPTPMRKLPSPVGIPGALRHSSRFSKAQHLSKPTYSKKTSPFPSPPHFSSLFPRNQYNPINGIINSFPFSGPLVTAVNTYIPLLSPPRAAANPIPAYLPANFIFFPGFLFSL